MHELIKDIINQFGGRLAGSPQEKAAQEFIADKLSTFCSSVDNQVFKAALNAKPGSASLFALGFYMALGLFWWSPLAGFFLSLANAVLFYGQFVSYRGWLDFIYPKQSSSNVTGVLEPLGEVRSTILISAHIDSTREFIWWYWFKNAGANAMILAGSLFLLLPVFYLTVLLFSSGPDWSIIAWWVLLFLSPAALTFLFMRGRIVVQGAQDNLSGIAVAFSTIESFLQEGETRKSSLKHTRLKMVSFGSEEAGLIGSREYAKTYSERLKVENAILINLDGIMNLDEFHIVRIEHMIGIEYSANLIKHLASAFEKLSVHYRISNLKIGATDAASLSRKGVPSVTLLGLPIDRLDPTYHTRLDRPEFVDPVAMDKCKEVLRVFIRDWDEKTESSDHQR